MDVFYPLIPSVKDSIELRYSLRSLRNIEFEQVIIAGNLPSWVKGVVHIPFEDQRKRRIENVIQKILLACREGGSEDLLIMSDDIYITQPTYIGYYCSEKTLADMAIKKKNTLYRNSINRVLELFPGGITGFTHTPFRVNKQMVLDLDKRYDLLKYKFNIFSLYMNEYISLGYVPISNSKVTRISRWEDATKNTFCSSNNKVASTGEFERIMEKVLPGKSNFEK